MAASGAPDSWCRSRQILSVLSGKILETCTGSVPLAKGSGDACHRQPLSIVLTMFSMWSPPQHLRHQKARIVRRVLVTVLECVEGKEI